MKANQFLARLDVYSFNNITSHQMETKIEKPHLKRDPEPGCKFNACNPASFAERMELFALASDAALPKSNESDGGGGHGTQRASFLLA